MDNNQHQVNRRHRNVPPKLKAEIVDCFPVENAAHFLASVPNRLIIHDCAPRVRAMLKKINQVAADYARTLPAPFSDDNIILENGHHYTPEMDIFLRYGAAHRDFLFILSGPIGGFVGYPANFFDDLIQHYYETRVPEKAVRDLRIELPWANSAPWPAALVQPRVAEMNVEVVEVDNAGKRADYILRNKHNPAIAFELTIRFEGVAKCYQKITHFVVWR